MSRIAQSCEPDTWMPVSNPKFLPFLIFVAFLVVLGGIASGLQQGLMQIDKPSFRVMKDECKSSVYLRLLDILEPLLENRHLTLVTLLISNSVAMESLPIFLDVLVPQYFSILFSVTLLLVFGEILPQALCLRYPGQIASVLAPLVWFLMIIFYPIAYPISQFLDWLLGAQHGRTYTRVGLGELLREQRRVLSVDELDVITGALELWGKVARHSCLPMDHVFKLSYYDNVNDKVIRNILSHGHSRVPIWKDSEDNIIGLILVKHLIRINSGDSIAVCDLQILPMFNVREDCSMFELLRKFQTGASHMAVIRPSENLSFREVHNAHTAANDTQEFSSVEMTSIDQKPIKGIGIVTLEDVIEQLLKRNIEDETDIWQPINQRLDSRILKVRSLHTDILSTLKQGEFSENLDVRENGKAGFLNEQTPLVRNSAYNAPYNGDSRI